MIYIRQGAHVLELLELLVLPEQPVKAAVIAESAITVAKNFFILISFQL